MNSDGDLVAFPTGPNPDVVERLEELLRDAKAGEITAIAYAADYRNMFAGSFVGVGTLAMIGELRILEARVVEAIRKNSGG